MTKEFRIFGPPGCGKTTTLEGLIAEACREVGSESVLVSSFTRTAARVLVRRNLPVNDDQVGTLHAHCYRALERPKLVTGPLLKDWNAEHPTQAFGGIGVDVDDPYANFESTGKGTGDSLLEEYNRLRGLMVPEEAWPLRVQSFAEDWKDFKSNTWTVDFTDLIEQCVAFQTPIPHKAKTFFLDEVQDFTPLELSLCRYWGSQTDRLYLVGDEDQCLYRFKGATPDAFLQPEISAGQIRVLDQSYRVPRAVHASAMAWIEPVSVRMPKVYRPRDVEGKVDTLNVNYKYPDPLRDLLAQWTGDGKSVMLLASCSFFLDPMKRALRDWGVPFHNPYRLSRGDWNPLGGVKKHDPSVHAPRLASDRLRAYRKVKHGAWWTYADLWDWAGVLEGKTLFTHGAKTAMRRKAEDDQTAGLPVDPVDMDAWFADVDAADKATAGDLGWYREKVLGSYERPIDYACNIIEAHGEEALTKKPLVTLGTIHSVKGGESSIVVLFPDLSQAGYQEWATPGESHDSVRRCFYVGMTRAKEELYWAQPVGISIGGYL